MIPNSQVLRAQQCSEAMEGLEWMLPSALRFPPTVSNQTILLGASAISYSLGRLIRIQQTNVTSVSLLPSAQLAEFSYSTTQYIGGCIVHDQACHLCVHVGEGDGNLLHTIQ